MNDALRESLRTKLDATDAPPGDPADAIRSGRRQRRRRSSAVVAVASAAVMAVGFVTLEPGTEAPAPNRQNVTEPSYVRVAAYDLSEGMRAWATPDADGEIHLGDQTYSTKGMEYLDTDATATPFGMVFFDRDQKPRLLGDNGAVVELGDGPATPSRGFHPSSKVDSVEPWVAWTVDRGDKVEVVLYDLDRRAEVARRTVPCEDDCKSVVVDALDKGVVFVRTPGGTFAWDHGNDGWMKVGGPKLRVADVRNGVLLYTGETPTLRGSEWTQVKGAIDAQLTYDGKNILYWSNILKPANRFDRTVKLEQGGDSWSWFAIDTDGSVLVATTERRSPEDGTLSADVHDCEVPSGDCTKIGSMTTTSGDPMFIGVDM